MFSEEIESKKYVYHVTRNKNRESIKLNGLIPKVGNSYAQQAKKYLEERTDAIPAIFVNNSNEYYGNKIWDWDVWRINTSVLDNKWIIDDHMRVSDKRNYLLTYEGIPRHAIELIHEGKH